VVAVVGAAAAGAAALAAAEAVGRGVAGRGWTLLTGGRGGVMAAASRGAAEAGGLVVGLLPGPDASEANPWVAVPLATGLGNARNAVIVQAAQAVVAIAGGWGTLSEIALARKCGRPVVAVAPSVPLPDVVAVDTPAAALAQLDAWLSPGVSPGDPVR
jgi:hypothetical protein